MSARRLFPLLLLLLLALVGCAHAPARNPLAIWMPSPNVSARRAQLIVLHATESPSLASALDALRDRHAAAPVSAHYLIAEDGTRYQLAPDAVRAWHAGAGQWGDIEDVNSASLGIELDHRGDAPYPPAQIASLVVLLRDLTTRLGIDPRQVIGHADLAPARKSDPGPTFPWSELAAAGFGRWPCEPLPPLPPAGFDPWLALRLIGYPLDDRAATARAFHEHYRGDRADTLDARDAAILYDLQLQLLGPADAAPPDDKAHP
jgi:N-acetylmuramoyl-L-alanine amidase